MSKYNQQTDDYDDVISPGEFTNSQVTSSNSTFARDGSAPLESIDLSYSDSSPSVSDVFPVPEMTWFTSLVVSMLKPFDALSPVQHRNLYPYAYSALRRVHDCPVVPNPPVDMGHLPSNDEGDGSSLSRRISDDFTNAEIVDMSPEMIARHDAELAKQKVNYNLNHVIGKNFKLDMIDSEDAEHPVSEVLAPIPFGVPRSPFLFHRLLAEFIGVFIISFNSNLNQNNPVTAWMGGLVALCCIYAVLPMSSAHVNSNITLILAMRKGFTRTDFCYMFTQTISAIAGFYLSNLVIPDVGTGPAPNYYNTYHVDTSYLPLNPSVLVTPRLHPVLVMIVEAFGAGIFAPVILTFSPTVNGAISQSSMLALGAYMCGAGSIWGPITGAMINPSVGIGYLANRLLYVGIDMQILWIFLYYVLAPTLGALMAGFLVRLWENFREEENEWQRETTKIIWDQQLRKVQTTTD